jgi:hypothetical protein
MNKQGQVESDIEEIRRDRSDPDIMDAFISLVRDGRIVNSGRRRNGKIVWAYANPKV